MRELFLSTEASQQSNDRPATSLKGLILQADAGTLSAHQARTRRALRRLSAVLKRAIDVAASLVALPLLSPLFLLIVYWIKRDSPGPILYRGPRAARGGGAFNILKFRTMYERPESYAGPSVTAKDDDRITPIGRWLRDTKLNELPQLWNVLWGDMSLVGPRPEDPAIAADWPEDARREILSVRPGITSPASVLYSDEESLLRARSVMNTYLQAIMPSKLRLDQLYVRHRSLLLDLDVILYTALLVLPGVHAGKPAEESLFWGPFSRFVRRHLSWLTIDLIISLVAFVTANLIWGLFNPLPAGWALVVVAAGAVFALIFGAANALVGVNRIAWSRAQASDVLDLIPASLLALVTAVILNLLWQPSVFPLGLLLLACALALGGAVTARYRSRLVTGLAWRLARTRVGFKQARERVLIVGGGEAGELAIWLLRRRHLVRVMHIVGFVDDNVVKLGMRISGVRVLGHCGHIADLVRRHDIGIILYAIHNAPPERRQQILEICRQTGAHVVPVPDMVKTFDEALTPNGQLPASSSAPFI